MLSKFESVYISQNEHETEKEYEKRVGEGIKSLKEKEGWEVTDQGPNWIHFKKETPTAKKEEITFSNRAIGPINWGPQRFQSPMRHR